MKIKMYVLSLFFLFIPIIFYFSGIDFLCEGGAAGEGSCGGEAWRVSGHLGRRDTF